MLEDATIQVTQYRDNDGTIKATFTIVGKEHVALVSITFEDLARMLVVKMPVPCKLEAISKECKD